MHVRVCGCWQRGVNEAAHGFRFLGRCLARAPYLIKRMAVPSKYVYGKAMDLGATPTDVDVGLTVSVPTHCHITSCHAHAHAYDKVCGRLILCFCMCTCTCTCMSARSVRLCQAAIRAQNYSPRSGVACLLKRPHDCIQYYLQAIANICRHMPITRRVCTCKAQINA